MLPDDWRHVSLSAQELVKDMLKLDVTGARTVARSLLQRQQGFDAQPSGKWLAVQCFCLSFGRLSQVVC